MLLVSPSLMYEYPRRRHIMNEHRSSLIKTKPKDPIHNKFDDELKQEENLRDRPQYTQIVNFRKITAVGTDVVQQTTFISEYLG